MRRFLVIALFLPVVACGTALSPTQYRDDVGVFAEGVRHAAAVYAEERDRFVGYYEARVRDELLKTRPELSIGVTRRGCNTAVAELRLVLSDPAATTETFLAAQQKVLATCQLSRAVESGGDAVLLRTGAGDFDPRHQELIKAVARYADGLARLADSAADREKFDTAAGETKDELLAFLRAVNKQRGDGFDFSQEADVIAGVINEAVASGLEAKRRFALERIVETTQPAVAASAEVLAMQTRLLHVGLLPDLRRKFFGVVRETSSRRGDPGAYERGLDAALAAQREFQDYVREDPGRVFDEMVDAHLALAAVLGDRKADLRALAGQVQHFRDVSKDVLDAVKSVRRKIEEGSER